MIVMQSWIIGFLEMVSEMVIAIDVSHEPIMYSTSLILCLVKSEQNSLSIMGMTQMPYM